LFYAFTLVALQACGGCEDEAPAPAPLPTNDGGTDERDEERDAELPVEIPDAGNLYPGEPPEELEGQLCAADTNKVYELVSGTSDAQPALLAVDGIRNRFGMAFVSAAGAECSTSVQFAELYGVPGAHEPEPMLAYDGCTLIERAAIARGTDHWLLAIVDNRMESRDLWVHAFDPESGDTVATHRVTENMANEGSVAFLPLDDERILVAWSESAFDGTGSSLRVQVLSGEGEPTGEPVEIEPASTTFYTALTTTRLGNTNDEETPLFIGLAYKRDDSEGNAAFVLDVLHFETLERDRDPWVLTTTPGAFGSIDLDSDNNGGGVVYTVEEGISKQVWFQQLGNNGRAAPVMRGNVVGGPSEPSRVIGNPELGIDVSLAKLPIGFVIAYRGLPSVAVPQAQVRTFFLDRNGERFGQSAVALAEEGGGQTAIEVANDGRAVLSWTDTAEDGSSTLRALVVPCVGN
jgi:hypothetical protein